MKRGAAVLVLSAGILTMGGGVAMALELNPNAHIDTSQIQDRRPKCVWYKPWQTKGVDCR
ncbi:hypothetical protein [Micromonospora siamensis]|nr:hypothetical protein [Micromonospora siamensis]